MTNVELNKRANALRDETCDPNANVHGLRRFSEPTTVGESLGKTVRTIRVVSFAPMSDSRIFDHLKTRLLDIWTGKVQSSYCYIAWAEPTLWLVEAELEFEDGKRGVLISDGLHVALRDHNGRTWYLRLLPAAQ